MAQKIREIMTTDLVTVSPRTPLAEAARLMRDNGVGDVLVIDRGRLVGIVTDRDLVLRGVAEDRDMHGTMIAEICSRDPVCVSPEEDIEQAVGLMRSRAVRRIPILEDGRPVGVVSLGDLAMERDPHSALADISAAPSNM